MKEFFRVFREQLGIYELDIKTYSPLSLAFVGDSIYDCLVKLYLLGQGNRPANDFHKMTKEYVKASEQARILERITPMLDEEELRIVRWGRNAKSQSVPKNASKADYQQATGFECLLGFFLLTERYDRLIECVVEGIKNDKADTAIH